ncbi:TPA: hypothetical protein ACNTDB_004950, partial [Escherichia coli]
MNMMISYQELVRTFPNTGNAPAYNVEVVFDPPLVNAEHREKSEIPFSKVSVLKNGQSLTSNLCKYEQ